MRKLIAVLLATAVFAAGLLTVLLVPMAGASNGGGSQHCEYWYNPIAGNYVVQTQSYGQYKNGSEGKTYTTDRPPASCNFQGDLGGGGTTTVNSV